MKNLIADGSKPMRGFLGSLGFLADPMAFARAEAEQIPELGK